MGTTYGGTHEVFGVVEFQLIDPDGNVVPGESVMPGAEHGVHRLSVPYVNGGGGVVEITSAPDGGVLVAGDPFLLELRPDGSPNPGFGDEGMVKKVPFMVGARVLPDGSVEAVGSSSASPNSLNEDLYVLRLTAAGAPDTGFGKDGIRRFDLGGVEEAHAALWGPDDSVVVGGSAQPRGSCYRSKDCREMPILAAFDSSGAPVRDFGRRGVLRMKRLAGTSTHLYGDGVLGLTRRRDGAIVAAGGTGPKATTAFLAALSPRGRFLRGFGTDGVVRAREPRPASQLFSGLAPLPRGKLLASGRSDVGIAEDAVLVRYDADGALDRTFGAGSGFVRYGRGRFINGPAVDSSQRALMSIYDPPRSKVLELRTGTGSPERRFGGDGLVRLPESVYPVALDFTEHGGAVVAATRDVAGTAEPGLVLRYRPGGKLDHRFGKGGTLALRTPGDLEVRVRSLLAGVGKPILVGGVSRHHFAVARLLPNGSPDPGFGTRGWDVMNVAGTPFHLGEGGPEGVAMSRAGSGFYFAGVAQHGERHRVELFRFDADGQPDPSFGNDGRRVASISEGAEPTAVVPAPGGVYVALAQGVKPLIFFPLHGRARKEPLGRRALFASDVVATTSDGKLVLGWNGSVRAGEESGYHLSERPLASR
ncbi:MAG TPA: delta-60 repeat domain-containing protein [Solirubrobacterales bacterium]